MSGFGIYGGIQIMEDPTMVRMVEDWSHVRSPARAIRRRRKGYPQNIFTKFLPKTDVFQMGSTLVMHPETARLLKAKIQEQGR